MKHREDHREEIVLYAVAHAVQEQVLPRIQLFDRLDRLLPGLEFCDKGVEAHDIASALEDAVAKAREPENPMDTSILLALRQLVSSKALEPDLHLAISEEHTTCSKCGYREHVPEPEALGCHWTCPKCGTEGLYGSCYCVYCWSRWVESESPGMVEWE